MHDHDIYLLRRLKEKLTIGNRRSVHLNALPGKLLNRLDPMQLELLHPQFPARFLETLLTKHQFSFTASYQRPDKSIDQLSVEERQALLGLAKRADALVFENNDHRSEYGFDAFGFGFPLLIKRDRRQPEKIIKAPIFIWRLQFEKIISRAFQWQISRQDGQIVYLNPVLLAHLEADEGISLKTFKNELSEDTFLDAPTLLDICNRLLATLQADNEYPQVTITYCPSSDTLKHIDFDKPRLRWSGVFGLFKVPKQAIIADLDALIKRQTNEKNADTEFDATADEPLLTPYSSFVREEEETIQAAGILLDQVLSKPALSNTIPPFAALPTDPSQQEILQRLSLHDRQVVQGPPGTGKSQSLTAVLTVAAAAGLRCLVICEKRTALEVLQQNLSGIGLQPFCALIEDIDRDRNIIVDQVRHQLDNTPDLPNFSIRQYETELQQITYLYEKINAQHYFLAKNLLGTYTWTDIVGLYLEKEAVQSKEILNKYLYLQSSLLDYTFEEYEGLLQTALQGQPLFDQASAPREHPLAQIGSRFFVEKTSGEAYFDIERIGRQLLDETRLLKSNLLKFTEKYANDIAQLYQQYDEATCDIVLTLNTLLKDNLDNYGEDFANPDGFKAQWIKVMAWAVGRYKKISRAQKSALLFYGLLKDIHQEQYYFAHIFRQNVQQAGFTFHALKRETDDFTQKYSKWQQERPQIIRQWVDGLHEQYIHPNMETVGRHWEALAAQYLQLMEKVGSSGLLGRVPTLSPSEYPIGNHYNKDNTPDKANGYGRENLVIGAVCEKPFSIIWRELQLLEAVLNGIVQTLPEFKVYYNWRNFYENSSPKGKMLLDGFMATKPRLWREAFESWYFNWLLVRRELEEVPHNALKIQQSAQQTTRLQALQVAKIWNQWYAKRHLAINAFNKRYSPFTVKRLYNKRGNKDYKRSSLRQIIQADFGLFTSFFPIILTNPVVCSSLFLLKEELFDLVIFDEAGQLRLEDTYCALLRGKHRIVSGDSQQMPPSDYFLSQQTLLASGDEEEDADNLLPNDEADLADQESLLDYAESKQYCRSFLDFHYRSRHHYLIDFSNAAFYNNRLVTVPAAADYKSIRFWAVNGIYHQKINAEEADKVIAILLNDIRPNQDGTWPSVGVATFNLYQRNYILSKLQTLKSEGNLDICNRIAGLEASGLFVKNLENIQGDERDIMLLSVTFGKRPDGKFLQFFGPLNQGKGYRLLNVIITRAKQMVYVLCSIPPEFYGRYVQELENARTGRAYLYAYLSYAQAIENGSEDIRKQILAELTKYNKDMQADFLTPKNRSGEKTLPFTAYITRLLRQHLPPDYGVVNDVSYGGFAVRVVVTPPQAKETATVRPFALELDDAPQHNSSVAYMHDIYREKQLSALGFCVLRLYSANWWLNPDKELELLLQKLKGL